MIRSHRVAPPDPMVQPTMTVEQAGEVFGIARASAYEGVRTGEIPSIRIGRRILVPTAAICRMLGFTPDDSLAPAPTAGSAA